MKFLETIQSKVPQIQGKVHSTAHRRISMAVPLVCLLLAAGLLPMFIHGRILAGSVGHSQTGDKSVALQNQCQILSSQITRGGSLSDSLKDPSIDAQLNLSGDLFDGRIMVIDKNYKVIKDTFGLAAGKLVISEEVIRCFQGESSSQIFDRLHYLVQTCPIYDNTGERSIQGVLVAAASTARTYQLQEAVKDHSRFLIMITAVVLVLFSMGSARLFIRPLKRLLVMVKSAAEGRLDTEIDEHTYRETEELSDAMQKTLTKLNTVDKSRQEFVSNVSHELKTPITSIRVLADSLMGMENAPVELYQEFMADISDEIDRESKIIDDLLSLVKMDKTGSGQMNIEQISINSLTEVILKRLRPIAKKRNIELIFESIREVSADVDEVKLSLALNNLVENAIKYNRDDGWVKVTLDSDHKAFYVTVSDSGIGIPEEFTSHIFERFYRVDKARSRETGGTGLGLAITRSAILAHHGTIKVESREGEGTTFTVRIPLNFVPLVQEKPGGGGTHQAVLTKSQLKKIAWNRKDRERGGSR